MAFNPNDMTCVTLSNGVKMPQLGYGVFQVSAELRPRLTRAAARQCRERYAHLARRSGCQG